MLINPNLFAYLYDLVGRVGIHILPTCKMGCTKAGMSAL